MSETRPCRRCGRNIELIEGPSGKAIPAVRVCMGVYALTEEHGSRRLSKIVEFIGEGRAAYISHHEMCPNANDFHKGRNRSARHR